jgi:polyketide biosynthesis 3-hydroxy-3-methylglutaryl-CoA synthase-like enzyme PksG
MSAGNGRMQVGIEAMNVFGGSACLDVMALARHRNLDRKRFENLLMKEKAVALPCEDPVTFGVNASSPLLSALSEADKERIELLITCTESGLDFGKSLSTYLHHYLGLKRNCRLFEIKQACYSGTAGLQMAASFILSGVSPGAKALVVATDVSRSHAVEGGSELKQGWSFGEPSGGSGAVAALVSDTPLAFQMDVGASGYYGYEVMDTCRPTADSDEGDVDLSLLSYIDCCENTFLEYGKRVSEADYRRTFQYLAFHTPFGGMVKGAHRSMMRKYARGTASADVESDFAKRVGPGLEYCQRVGNIMGATVLLSLASVIDRGEFPSARRIGCFSYGSGCCSEFYSGVVSPDSQSAQRRFRIGARLDERRSLPMDDYERLLRSADVARFGARNVKLDEHVEAAAAMKSSSPRLVLREIRDFHRKYEWLS